MKKLIFISILLTSCVEQKNNQKHSNNEDIKDVISIGYNSFLDSLNRPKFIYHKYAQVEDSIELIKFAYNIKYDLDEMVLFSLYYDLQSPKFNSIEIDEDNLVGFTTINKRDIDSILNDSTSSLQSFYAITRPFKIDTTDLYVMQEFRLPYNLGCINRRRRDLIFEKVNGNYILLNKGYVY